MQPIRVGIVGLGLVARSHLKGYASHPQARVVALCDLDRVQAEQFAARHGLTDARIYTDYDEMVAQSDIDLIDIGTPNDLHAEMTRKAAQASKHIHCEKPFCRSVGEEFAAVNAAREHGVKLVVGETYVFIASHMKARALIEAGEIGCPLQIRQRHGAWIERREGAVYSVPADRSWRVDPVKSGGGAYPWIFDHAVHFFATAEYLMLDAKIAEVCAVAATNTSGVKHTGAAHDPYVTAETDIPIITWKYADEAAQGVWMRAERLNGKYDFMRGFSTVVVGESGMIEVLGEGGDNLFWQGQPQHLILHREGKDSLCFRFDEGGDDVWESDICYYSQGHVNHTHHLLDCILENREPRYTGEDGVHAVRCTLATIRSAKEGRPIKVADIEPEYTA